MDMVNKSSIDSKYTVSLPLDAAFSVDALLAASSFTETERTIIGILCRLSKSYNEVFVSQIALGRWAGVTRRQVNRVILKLANMGVISKIYREYNSSVYLIADFFKTTKIKNLLKNIIPSIIDLPFSICDLLIVTLRNKSKMDTKDYKKKRLSAPYHRIWTENQKPNTYTKQSGFKHISEATCPIVKSFKDSTKPTPVQTHDKKLVVNDVPLIEKFNKLADQIPQDKLLEIQQSGFDMRGQIRIAENYLAVQKIKEELSI